MFKIISVELKKIVSKPGIYILSVLLALILVLGVFIYKPTVYENTQFELGGSTFIDKYTDFTRSDNAGKRAENQTKKDNAIKSIENYQIIISDNPNNIQTYTQKEYIKSLQNQCNELYNAYQDCSFDGSSQTDINTIRSNLIKKYENLNNAIETALTSSSKGSFTLLTTTTNYNNYKSAYKNLVEHIKINIQKENLAVHLKGFESKYQQPLYSAINNFKYPTLSKSLVDSYTSNEENTKLSILNHRLDEISKQIEEFLVVAKNDTQFNNKYGYKMDELANLYANTVDTFVNLVKYELVVNAFNYTSSVNEELKTLYLSKYSNYNSKSLLKRYEFLFTNNKSEVDVAKPLTIGVTSNNHVNAYDYSYFIMKVFAFVIIVYAIMSACHSISGEIKEGSMRYLAIRPVSRTTMLMGKWISILVISSILMVFSGIISLCVGGAVYGFASNEILAIFNGNFAFTIHPLGMIGIFLASMMFELIIYSLIALLLSVLFKSDLMSMTILLVVYLLNTLLPVFVQGANTWLAYYPFSHISLYSLFGSAVYGLSQNFFNLVFGAKIYAGSHIALTISMILLISVVVGTVAIKLFKRKEL